MPRLRNKPPAERPRCLDGSLEKRNRHWRAPARGQRRFSFDALSGQGVRFRASIAHPGPCGCRCKANTPVQPMGWPVTVALRASNKFAEYLLTGSAS